MPLVCHNESMFSLPKLHLALTPTKVVLLIFISLTAIIPAAVFLLSQRFKAASLASENFDINGKPVTSLKEVPKNSSLKGSGNGTGAKDQSATSSGEEEKPTAKLTFGSTMDFKIKLEGRPNTDNSAKIFLGIASGQPRNSPKYLLSFSIDVPQTGEYKGLSIAGLDQGKTYSAYIKGPAQIATASAFNLNSNYVNLNPTGEPILLTTGDLNEDNVIDSLDLDIAQKASGLTPTSSKWNPLADFNLDKIINSFDIGIIKKNLGKTGLSGVWYSRPPASASAKAASGSAMLEGVNRNQGSQGYWIWVPRF